MSVSMPHQNKGNCDLLVADSPLSAMRKDFIIGKINVKVVEGVSCEVKCLLAFFLDIVFHGCKVKM
jgi:hypothetical protein